MFVCLFVCLLACLFVYLVCLLGLFLHFLFYFILFYLFVFLFVYFFPRKICLIYLLVLLFVFGPACTCVRVSGACTCNSLFAFANVSVKRGCVQSCPDVTPLKALVATAVDFVRYSEYVKEV